MEYASNNKTLATIFKAVAGMIFTAAVIAVVCVVAHNNFGLLFEINKKWILPAFFGSFTVWRIGSLVTLPWRELSNLERMRCVVGVLLCFLAVGLFAMKSYLFPDNIWFLGVALIMYGCGERMAETVLERFKEAEQEAAIEQ